MMLRLQADGWARYAYVALLIIIKPRCALLENKRPFDPLRGRRFVTRAEPGGSHRSLGHSGVAWPGCHETATVLAAWLDGFRLLRGPRGFHY